MSSRAAVRGGTEKLMAGMDGRAGRENCSDANQLGEKEEIEFKRNFTSIDPTRVSTMKT